jgi:hypothetical protein
VAGAGIGSPDERDGIGDPKSVAHEECAKEAGLVRPGKCNLEYTAKEVGEVPDDDDEGSGVLELLLHEAGDHLGARAKHGRNLVAAGG